MDSQDTYDLKINTFRQNTNESVRQIANLLNQPDKWSAFNNLYKRFTK